MPVVRIDEVSRDQATGLLYVAVSVWASRVQFNAAQPPRLREDFLMQIVRDGTRVVIDGVTGWPVRDSDGLPINPALISRGDTTVWRREAWTTEIRDRVLENIRAYLQRAAANGYRDDRRDDTRPRVMTDPDGAISDAAGLVGLARDE